jgi:hypothetical protein
MPKSIGTLRDVKIAALIGGAVEALLACCAFEMGGDLVGRHPWLEISQMPGAQIAERLFRWVGLAQALTFAVLFQGIVFAIIVLGILYGYRLLQARAGRL